MKNRGFMLWPLFEVAPDLTFPDGISLRPFWTTSTRKTRPLVIRFLAINQNNCG
jgi:7,8-dihydro-6-hydroxymethylpterin-pyrophosphokinase